MAQLGARFNRTEEVAGSNPARSILAVIFRGPWRSWERVSMALRRSRVRVPLGPLIDLYLYGKCTRGNKKGRRMAVFFCQMQCFVYSFANTFRNVANSLSVKPRCSGLWWLSPLPRFAIRHHQEWVEQLSSNWYLTWRITS